MSLLLPATSESNSFTQLSLNEIVGGGRGDTLSMGSTDVKNTVCPSLLNFCPPSINSEFVICFVLETIRTVAMRVIHITVNTEETQILRIEFVLVLSYKNSSTTCTVLPESKHNICQQFALYCPTCVYQHKQNYLSNCQSGQRSWQQVLLTDQ